jgi:hypothetical protein
MRGALTAQQGAAVPELLEHPFTSRRLPPRPACKMEVDQRFEFDAPRFYDFQTMTSGFSPVDTWFETAPEGPGKRPAGAALGLWAPPAPTVPLPRALYPSLSKFVGSRHAPCLFNRACCKHPARPMLSAVAPRR